MTEESRIENLKSRLRKLFKDKFNGEVSLKSHLLKLKEEVLELEENTNSQEFADVFLCFLACFDAKYPNIHSVNVIESAENKMTINENRNWIKSENGTWKHLD